MIKKLKNKLSGFLPGTVKVDLNKFSYTNSDRVANIKDFQKKHRFSILPVSFFEPIPDLRKINIEDFSESGKLLDLNIKYDFSFIEKNLNKILNDNIIPDWLLENPMFSVLDQAAYLSIIEKYRPQNIIEIGAGYSTCFANLFTGLLNLNTSITAIEPYPESHLIKLKEENKISLVKKTVQEIDSKELDKISKLKENDILFIDTSHVTTINSDTNFIFIKLLPLLQKGVNVQFHDIYLPYDYSRSIYYGRGTFYNEQYLLASILANSNSYTPLYSSFPIYLEKFNTVRKNTDDWLKPDIMRSGVSFWMQKN